MTRVPAVARPVRPAIYFAVVAAFLFLVLFWQLGTPSFWDPDEAHYAQTTREMIATGDWWAPHYNQEPFFDKPILFHQLQGMAMLVVGQGEFGARIVPALAALALVLVTMWLGATLVSLDVGVVAGLLLTVSPGMFALARYAILDTLFTAFLFGGLALVVVSAFRDRPLLQYPGYVLIALAVLTKGPLALVLCGLAMGLSIAASREVRRRVLGLRWIVGLAIVMTIAAPWFVYMYLRYRQAFVAGYLLDENLRLFASGRFGQQPPFWFYFQILAAGMLPWTGMLIGRLVDDVRQVMRRRTPDPAEVLLWSWTAAIVGFFTLSTFKLDHYVFPAAPALCLLCARAWVDVGQRPSARENAGARVGVHMVGPLLVAIGIGGGYFLIARLELPPLAMVVPGVVAACGAGMTARLNVRGGRPWRTPIVAAGALVVTYAGVLLFVMPALESRKVVPDVARWVATHVDAGDRVASYRLNRWNTAFRFYVDQHTTLLEAPQEAEAFFKESAPFYCAMLESEFKEFVARGVPLKIVYAREGMWVTSGRALWRVKTPPTTFVIVTSASRGLASQMERDARDDRVGTEE